MTDPDGGGDESVGDVVTTSNGGESSTLFNHHKIQHKFNSKLSVAENKLSINSVILSPKSLLLRQWVH